MLRLTGVTAGYGATTVLRDVTLEVAPCTVVALLGANGAGKTTLLRVAAGSLQPSSGTVEYAGRDSGGERADSRARRGLCHIPEGRGIFPTLSVRDNITLFAARRDATAAIDLALQAFPALSGRLRQTAGTMSGGEQQMLALSRAYVCDPRLVLVDEASMGLAPFVVDLVFEFLQRVAAQGTALLVVEQYINRVLAIADRAYVLNRGSVAHSGPARDLLQDDVFERYVGATTN
ncbi:MAG: ABC transporter ATP-binding protein [Actinomycetota bacterium]|nr:MAG: ABC transporter ATP-binding protein [Actinomycetota bacterium]